MKVKTTIMDKAKDGSLFVVKQFEYDTKADKDRDIRRQIVSYLNVGFCVFSEPQV